MRTRAAALSVLLLFAALAADGCRTAPKAPAARSGGPQAQAAPSSPEALRLAAEKIRPLHTVLGSPQPGDWLATFHEPGQTFDQYLQSTPTRPEGERRVLYVQPLGQFTPAQTHIVTLAADFMSRFFNLAVRVREPAPLGKVPHASATRASPPSAPSTASATSGASSRLPCAPSKKTETRAVFLPQTL
ncbi:MAG: hypothetical protein ABW208_03335 [Pyrinomonadaceae bacterium]